jgi:subtilase family serine protease
MRTFQINLNMRNETGLEAFVAAVSNPKSAQYGHYLSVAGFNRLYSPTAATVARVSSWLRTEGFKLNPVPSNNRYIEATGSISRIDAAFDTTIKMYGIKGSRYAAPSTALSVPGSLGHVVLAVTGLDDGGAMTRPDDIRLGGSTGIPAKDDGLGPKCSTYYGQHTVKLPKAYGISTFPSYICGYTGPQLEDAYGVSGAIGTGNDGSGVTVAITDAYDSPTLLADAQTFSHLEHVAPLAPGQLVDDSSKTFNDDGICGGEPAWQGEQTLDVESVHSMAPGADIVFVGAKNCETALEIDAPNKIVAGHLASIVTDSWGNGGENEPAAELDAENAIFLQGAAEGIGFNFSSGDDGDELASSGEVQPSVPASDPNVTAVGGTSLAVGSAGNYEWETGWGDEYDFASGNGWSSPLPGTYEYGATGGTSHVFAEPWYQDGVVPSNLADEYGNPARVVPDISALADPYTGFKIVITTDGGQYYETYGGTSLASPLLAGIEALANQARAVPIGFANPLIYSFSGTSAYHDVTPTVVPLALDFNPARVGGPNENILITLDHDSSLQVTAGYDNVTGVGTPNGSDFLADFSASAVPPPPPASTK